MQAEQIHGANRALGLAALAFFTCFYVWSLYGPLSPVIQHGLGLSEVQLGLLVAIPVVMGSLMRVPMGVLTDRYGARLTFPALMAFTALPLVAIAIWHTSFASLVAFGFLLGFAGSSFAIGVPYVSRWYSKERQGFALGVYGMGMGGSVLTALTAPTIVQRWGLSAMFVLGAVGGADDFVVLPAVAVEGVRLPALADYLAPAFGRDRALPEELVQPQQGIASVGSCRVLAAGRASFSRHDGELRQQPEPQLDGVHQALSSAPPKKEPVGLGTGRPQSSNDPTPAASCWALAFVLVSMTFQLLMNGASRM